MRPIAGTRAKSPLLGCLDATRGSRRTVAGERVVTSTSTKHRDVLEAISLAIEYTFPSAIVDAAPIQLDDGRYAIDIRMGRGMHLRVANDANSPCVHFLVMRMPGELAYQLEFERSCENSCGITHGLGPDQVLRVLENYHGLAAGAIAAHQQPSNIYDVGTPGQRR